MRACQGLRRLILKPRQSLFRVRSPWRLDKKRPGAYNPGPETILVAQPYISMAMRFLSAILRSYHQTNIGLAMKIEL